MRKKLPGSKGKLYICGTGISVPGDVTQETLRLLGACDTVFYLHADGEMVQEALRRLCPGLRLTLLDHARTPHTELFRRVKAELAKGRDTAYLTYGSPLLFSEAEQLANHCRLNSVPFRVVPAPSSVESVLGLLAERGRWKRGQGYCALRPGNLPASPGSFPCGHMLLIFCAHEELARDGEQFWRLLERCYPPRHPVYLAAAGHTGGEAAYEETRVHDLRARTSAIKHRMTIVLPPLAEKKPARRPAAAGPRLRPRFTLE